MSRRRVYTTGLKEIKLVDHMAMGWMEDKDEMLARSNHLLVTSIPYGE